MTIAMENNWSDRAPFGFLDRVARRIVRNQLAGLGRGEIVLRVAGSSSLLGQAADLQATLCVHHPRFFRDAVLGGTLSVAESYFRGDWDCDDLTSLFRIFVRNREQAGRLDGGLARLATYGQKSGGMMVCFLELDNGTMNRKQLVAKFRRYDAWSRSVTGQQYLLDLYRRHEAQSPRSTFRLLVVARDSVGHDERRKQVLAKTVGRTSIDLQRRTWLTTAADMRAIQDMSRPLEILGWETALDRLPDPSKPALSQRILFPVPT